MDARGETVEDVDRSIGVTGDGLPHDTRSAYAGARTAATAGEAAA